MQRSTSESLNQLINDYLHRYNVILNDKPSWIIKRSKLDGFGVFARQDIQPGEIIFKDYPIILGPRVTLKQNLCSICYNDANLTKCFSNCGLTLCTNCEKSVQHRRECEFILKSVKHSSNNDENGIDLLKSLPVIRGVLLDDQDKEVVEALKSHTGPQHEVQVKVLKDKLNFTISAENERFMRLVCGAFDANAFETPNKDKNIRASLRGLYPLASLANHNCTPNTFHIYDENYRMIVRASDFIKENTEIFHTYTRITWGTLMRRYHLLHTKRFLCKCDRCLDPKEKNTYIGSILCPKCKGNILAIDTSKLNSMWKCEYCEDSISSKQVRNLLILLDSTVCAFVDDDVDLIKKFIDNKLKYLVSEFNEIVIEAKYKFIWIVGYSEGFLWNEVNIDLLRTKNQFCKDILGLLSKLGLGLCKMKGLLLYELYKTQKELQNRGETNKINAIEMEKNLEASAFILQNDVNAPVEIQEMFNKNNYQQNDNASM